MSRRKNSGINLITIIFIIILIVVSIVIIRKITTKNNKNEQANNLTNQIEEDTEKNVKVLDDGTKLNISSKLKEEKKLEGLEITNTQITYNNGITNLLADVKNTTQSKMKMQNVEIVLLDEQGSTIYKMPGVIEEINAGETKQFNTSITADFAHADDFKSVTI